MLSTKTEKVFGLDVQLPEQRLFLLLLLLCFTVTVTTGTWDIGNSKIVLFHELIFIGGYFLALRTVSPIVLLVRRHPWVTALVAAWAISISLSLYFSPYGLRNLSVARARYYETLGHVAFFIALLSFFSSYRLDLKRVLVVILFSYALVVIHAFLTWHFSPLEAIHEHRMWFANFPFAGHARHAGYNMLVASLAGILLYLGQYARLVNRSSLCLGLTLVLSCFFWLGGRGAILALALALAVVAGASWPGLKRTSRYWMGLGALLVLAALLAELTAHFNWNGIFGALGRSASADSVNQLSSGRLTIWKYSLESFAEYPMLGLGPQGYMFMPNQSFGNTVMPHNMIVQFLVEWGIIGAVLFISLLSVGLRRGFQLLRNQKSRGDIPVLWGATVALALTAHGLTDGTYYHGKPGFYLALSFAIWLAPFGEVVLRTDKKCQPQSE